MIEWARSLRLPREIRRIERLFAKRTPPTRPGIVYTERMLTCRHNGDGRTEGLQPGRPCPHCPGHPLERVMMETWWAPFARCTCCDRMWGPLDADINAP